MVACPKPATKVNGTAWGDLSSTSLGVAKVGIKNKGNGS
jgi:hypothetical protein